jgi:diguanylate cyclase (GGDEF)-like protein/PAS domain S-box-containing protein
MTARRTLAGRQMAVLFAAAGVLSFAAMAEHDAPRGQFALLGVAALASAAMAVRLPLARRWASSDLLLVGPAFALVGAAQSTGLLPQRTYASLFILVFAWIGAHHRPRTSIYVLPVGAVAYVVPVVVEPHGTMLSWPGFLVTMSVCVLIAETMARAIASGVASERDAARTAQTMRLILDSAAQPTVALDLAGNVRIANRAAVAALGYDDAGQLFGLQLHDLMHHTKRDGTPYPAEECPLFDAMAAGRPAQLDGEMFFRRDGSAFFADFDLQTVRHDDDTVGAVATFSDVTQRRRAERETHERLLHSQRAALTDPLTGVGNRRQADVFLASVAPGDAVVLVDVDLFKRVNDEHGHAAGDDVLRRLAVHLAGHVRADDHVARFGGEEFLLLLAGGASTAVVAVERIAAAWAEMSQGVTFSAGIAAHTAGRPVLETLAAADRALYEAKAQGRDRVVTAHPGGAVRA